MARASQLTADDLEWEEPPSRGGGRGMTPATEALLASVREMVPGLRARPGMFAVVDAYDDVKKASKEALKCRSAFKGSEQIEARLQFKAMRHPDGGSKLYVRLRA